MELELLLSWFVSGVALSCYSTDCFPAHSLIIFVHTACDSVQGGRRRGQRRGRAECVRALGCMSVSAHSYFASTVWTSQGGRGRRGLRGGANSHTSDRHRR